ncbi:MAG: enoyl-CoA hydratase/isomerase family protein [Acidimicrobiia bacterium]|nr:enoyl-CoA hydratase/isomerase family protein [Acidimicrobiia bacterium]
MPPLPRPTRVPAYEEGLTVHYDHIVITETEGYTRVEMAMPARRNALSEAHLRELLSAFEAIGQSTAPGVILSAQGPVFSAGHDLNEMASRDLSGTKKILGICSDVMQIIQSIPQVVLAQVEGLATAAGCQLVASCDLAVAGESSRFQLPGGRGGWFCTTPGVAVGRAVGRKHAMEMLLTGDPIDAATALAWGLINRVVPDDEVPLASEELMARATRGSNLSRAIGKQAFYRQIDMDLRTAYDFATEVMASASQIDDARETAAAFVEKRKPVFTDS